jgi:hypothetical protein
LKADEEVHDPPKTATLFDVVVASELNIRPVLSSKEHIKVRLVVVVARRLECGRAIARP